MTLIRNLGKATVLATSIMLVACASTEQKPADAKATPVASQFQQYQEDRPELAYISVDDEAADLTLSAIAGIYGKTVKLTDAFIEKTEAAPTFETLLKLREEKGDEAYQAELKALSTEDKAAYDEYLNSSEEVNQTVYCSATRSTEADQRPEEHRS